MNLNLTKPLAFFDLETTGIDVSKDRIVEIAVVKVLPDNSVLEVVDRVNPGIPIPKGASDVHGIHDEDVKDAPRFADIAKKYFDLLNDSDWAGYNSHRFDFPFVVEEFGRSGFVFDMSERKLVDVQRVFHLMEPRNLSAAYKFYCEKILDGAHGALADTRATLQILGAQLDRYPEKIKNDISFLHNFTKDGDFVDLSRRMYRDNGVPKFNFGKHKGRPVAEVLKFEPNYYDWIMKSDFPLDFKDKLTALKNEMKK